MSVTFDLEGGLVWILTRMGCRGRRIWTRCNPWWLESMGWLFGARGCDVSDLGALRQYGIAGVDKGRRSESAAWLEPAQATQWRE